MLFIEQVFALVLYMVFVSFFSLFCDYGAICLNV